MEHEHLDCRGAQCPMPIVKLYKKAATVNSGQTIEIICDDLAFPYDIKAWCEETGNTLIEMKTVGKNFIALIKKI